DNLNNFKVIIPTNDEQEKISLILSTIDAQIDNTEKLIQKNQELKKGLMQQLLTKGIGHTEFKKTEFGDIPDIWEIKKLSELANVIDSLHETPEYSEQGYPMIRVVDVNGKEINTKYTKFVSKDVFDKFTKKYIPRKNDIIMSRVGSYGQVSYLETDEKVCLGQNTVVITTDFDKKYIFYALSSNYVKNNIEKVTSGSSQKTLSLANIKDLKLLLPRIEEQNKIVAILSSIDEKIDKYQSKKIRLEEIKKGLMQQLLTGKIRVVL
ncbi:restriction endonuclease subunit S, partial [Clostridium perfringens]